MNYVTIWKREEIYDEVRETVSLSDAYQIEITKHFVCVRFSHSGSYLHTLAPYEFVTIEEQRYPKYYKVR